MEEKLKEVLKLIKENGSKEELNLKEEMVSCLLTILDDAGFKTLIILERPGINACVAASGISDEAVSDPVARLLTEHPGLLKRVIEKMAIMKMIQAKQDEDNTPPPEATIH